MNKRTQNVSTPGAEGAASDPAGATAGDAGNNPDSVLSPDDLPPDVQAVIAAEVQRQLVANRKAEARARMNPATGRDDLPTQEEALAQVKLDPKRRGILSRDGWVTASAPVKERDEAGYAKA